MKIIGGEFRIESSSLVSKTGKELTASYSLGRTCLYSILKALQGIIDKVLLPDYICRSIGEVPSRLALPFEHYRILPSFSPDLDDLARLLGESKEKMGIVLISYFGLVDLDDAIRFIRSNYPSCTIIVDDVQNYYGFGRHTDYDYCFTSFRKWFPVPDGAEIVQKNSAPIPEQFTLQPDYVRYKAAGNLLKNHTELIGDALCLELLEQGEKMMDEEYRFRASDLGQTLLQGVDIEFAADRRMKNAAYLHAGLERMGVRHLYCEGKTPLFIPIVVRDRDKIRKKLFSKNIFAPIHWPVEDRKMQGDNELYRTELSLICDQRYDEEDMERILRGIKCEM